jgi:UDP-glucuronate 4-epimerase
MAPMLFTKAILAGEPIKVFNNGNMKRDFTYVGDIVEGIVRVIPHIPQGVSDWNGRTSGISPEPYRVYNIGNGSPVNLMDFIKTIETELGMEAKKKMMPMQNGDVPVTWADCGALERDTGYHPCTDIREGVRQFIAWYKNFYQK